MAFARAVQGKEQYIEVRFSDPLEKHQDLRGLITVDKRKHLSFAIKGNSVRVYSSLTWFGATTVHVNPGIRNTSGRRIETPVKKKVYFAEIKPQARFAGKGKFKQWSYPYGYEHEGKLFVVYSIGKEDCGLSVLPVESLQSAWADDKAVDLEMLGKLIDQ